MAQLKAGDKAPAFSLEDQQGKTVKLSDFKGQKLLVYFYPKASTPGCTVQSCNVRDARRDFIKRGVAVVGVSPDKPSAQKKFDDKYELGFPLLADTDHAMAEAWGVWGEKSMYGRSTSASSARRFSSTRRAGSPAPGTRCRRRIRCPRP